MTAFDPAMFPPPGAPARSPLPTKHHRPASLVLPARPPKLIYLDLNHWIALSKAQTGHREGAGHREVLEACVRAVESGGAVFPLADAIYYEVSRIARLRQRHDLADVMDRVSRYRVITSRSVIADHEVEATLDRLIGPRPHPIQRTAYLDWGVARALGMQGGPRVRNERGADWVDAVTAAAELLFNRQVIEGPVDPDDEEELHQHGYNPYAAHEVKVRRAQQEVDQARRLADDPGWRRGRTRDVIAAREIIIELMDKLERGMAARNADFGMLMADEEAGLAASAEMPSYDVAVSMKTSTTGTALTLGPRTTSTTSMPSAQLCPTAMSSSLIRRWRHMRPGRASLSASMPSSCRALPNFRTTCRRRFRGQDGRNRWSTAPASPNSDQGEHRQGDGFSNLVIMRLDVAADLGQTALFHPVCCTASLNRLHLNFDTAVHPRRQEADLLHVMQDGAVTEIEIIDPADGGRVGD